MTLKTLNPEGVTLFLISDLVEPRRVPRKYQSWQSQDAPTELYIILCITVM